MTTILPDPDNARKHGKRSRQAIHESLNLGAGRSILIDADNFIIGGNGVFADAASRGMPVRIVESDGSELIAVKRTDLKYSDERRTALAIADNRTAELSTFNPEKLADTAAKLRSVKLPGFNASELHALISKGKNNAGSPEIEFAVELLECHNYIVLFFDNDVDWLQAKTLFDLHSVTDTAGISGTLKRSGVGRVIRGADAINRLIDTAAK